MCFLILKYVDRFRTFVKSIQKGCAIYYKSDPGLQKRLRNGIDIVGTIPNHQSMKI